MVGGVKENTANRIAEEGEPTIEILRQCAKRNRIMRRSLVLDGRILLPTPPPPRVEFVGIGLWLVFSFLWNAFHSSIRALYAS